MQKVLRSLILETLPLELRFQLELLSRRRDLINEEKHEEIQKLFKEYEVTDIVPLGPGTNRYAVKYKGYVIKIATDNDGKIDNFKEFKMTKRLYPYVTKTYEVSENGTILVAEYIAPFTSFGEMIIYADQIREILKDLSSTYLIGDVGISSKNYANWGLRAGSSQPVCLDFAYVYEVSSNLFVCNKIDCRSILIPDSDFNKLICTGTNCKQEYTFESIRAKLGNELHKHEIGNLSDEGYYLTESKVLTELSEQRSNYLVNHKQKKKEEKHEEDHDMSSNIENNMRIVENLRANNITVYQGTSKVIDTDIDEVENEDNEVIILTGTTSIIDDEDDVVFSCNIDDPSKTTVEFHDSKNEIVVIKEPKVNELEETISDSVLYDIENDNPNLDNWFVKCMYRAFSKFANKIGFFVKEVQLYDQHRDAVKDIMYASQYYRSIESAVFRSLVKFCNFTEETVSRDDGKGHRKIFTPPVDTVGTYYEPTLIFLSRTWIDRDMYESNDIAEIMNIYNSRYTDYNGIQNEWIDAFKERLMFKTKLPIYVIETIASTIESMICDIIKMEEYEEHDDFEDNVVISADVDILNPDVESDDSDDYDTEYYDYDDDDDEEDNNIKVKIHHNGGFDIIHIHSEDKCGPVILPIYCNLDEVDGDTISKSIVDDRNGIWNWLMHFTPSVTFTTNTPDKFINMNNKSYPMIKQFNIIIDELDGLYTIGIYTIDEIVDIRDNIEYIVTDDTMLTKINNVISDNIGFFNTSILKYILKNDDEILTQEEVYEITGNETFKVDEDYEVEVIEDYKDADENLVNVNSAAELAAIQAMMNDDVSALEEVAEEDYFQEQEEETAEVQIRTETSETDAEGDKHVYAIKPVQEPEPDVEKPMAFKPIYRFND